MIIKVKVWSYLQGDAFSLALLTPKFALLLFSEALVEAELKCSPQSASSTSSTSISSSELTASSNELVTLSSSSEVISSPSLLTLQGVCLGPFDTVLVNVSTLYRWRDELRLSLILFPTDEVISVFTLGLSLSLSFPEEEWWPCKCNFCWWIDCCWSTL